LKYFSHSFVLLSKLVLLNVATGKAFRREGVGV
jgi:hypothetical protein